MPAEFVNRLSELANAEQAPHFEQRTPNRVRMLAPPQTALTIRALRCEDQGRVSVTDERRHRQKDLPFCLSVCARGRYWPCLGAPRAWAAKVTASFLGRKFACLCRWMLTRARRSRGLRCRNCCA